MPYKELTLLVSKVAGQHVARFINLKIKRGKRGVTNYHRRQTISGEPPRHGSLYLPSNVKTQTRMEAVNLTPLFMNLFTHVTASESDENLVARLVARDETALIELHRRYAPRLTATVRQLLPHSLGLVDTLVEQAFVMMWAKAAQYDAARVSARAWCVVLTLHLLLERRQIYGCGYQSLEEIKDFLESTKTL
jgi:Sigma-70 region 2